MPARRAGSTLSSEVPAASSCCGVPKAADALDVSAEMVSVPGGVFWMGSEDSEVNAGDAEGPVREVELAPYAIDQTTVTNRAFTLFVEKTGYVTEAERFGWSFVFELQLPKAMRKRATYDRRVPGAEWWIAVNHACWRQPHGPGSNLEGLDEHPAVHISWNDASSYAVWAGKRLPTEAEWEYAARGGLDRKRYPWGDELEPDGRPTCRIWQGKFPTQPRPDRGFLWTSPVRTYPPNGYGLYEVSGNAWEWCADYWDVAWPAGRAVNPAGPRHGASRVIRGGSFLCHRSYCNRYRVAARSKNTPDSGTSNTGFRCARSIG